MLDIVLGEQRGFEVFGCRRTDPRESVGLLVHVGNSEVDWVGPVWGITVDVERRNYAAPDYVSVRVAVFALDCYYGLTW